MNDLSMTASAHLRFWQREHSNLAKFLIFQFSFMFRNSWCHIWLTVCIQQTILRSLSSRSSTITAIFSTVRTWWWSKSRLNCRSPQFSKHRLAFSWTIMMSGTGHKIVIRCCVISQNVLTFENWFRISCYTIERQNQQSSYLRDVSNDLRCSCVRAITDTDCSARSTFAASR